MYIDHRLLLVNSPSLFPLFLLPTSLLPQLTSPLPDFSVVKALQLLVWSAACGDFSLSQDPTNIHQMFVKV